MGLIMKNKLFLAFAIAVSIVPSCFSMEMDIPGLSSAVKTYHQVSGLYYGVSRAYNFVKNPWTAVLPVGYLAYRALAPSQFQLTALKSSYLQKSMLVLGAFKLLQYMWDNEEMSQLKAQVRSVATTLGNVTKTQESHTDKLKDIQDRMATKQGLGDLGTNLTEKLESVSKKVHDGTKAVSGKIDAAAQENKSMLTKLAETNYEAFKPSKWPTLADFLNWFRGATTTT